MVKEAKVDYDYENDILFVYTGEKAKDSLEVENFVIDFSSNNKIVSVEIFGASKFLKNTLDIKISKDDLSKIEKAWIKVSQGKEIIYVLVVTQIKIDKKLNDIRIPIPAAGLL